ncbi:MAG: DUF4054 domain-containing protein [Cyanobacteria bacterium J06634_6]
MVVTVSSFITALPQFSCEDEDRIALFISKAQLLVGSERKWGSLYDEAVELMTAHKLARTNEAASSTNGKAVGAVTRLEVENRYSETYASPSQQNQDGPDSEYQSTIYGQQYLSLRKRVIGACVIGIV